MPLSYWEWQIPSLNGGSFRNSHQLLHYYGVLRFLEPACSFQTQSISSAGNTRAELCGEILDVLWKENNCDIVAVLHLLQKVLVFGQQSEYASCNTLLNSLNIYCNALGIPYLPLGISQPGLVPVGWR